MYKIFIKKRPKNTFNPTMAILQLQHAPQVEKDQLHNGHLEVQQLRAFHPGCHNQHELVLIKSFVNIKFALISGYLKKNRLFG